MNVSMQAMNVLNFARLGGLKSTQEKMDRQQQCADQVNFFEKQKENLKNMQCGSLEDIARKLEMFHSYEDQIAAAKKAFNDSQMMHVLDEAEEIGEKIAEAAKEMAPKTPEERMKDKVEEAAGTEEENKEMLSEIMEEMSEPLEELEEDILKQPLEELEEDKSKQPLEELEEDKSKQPLEEIAQKDINEIIEEDLEETTEELNTSSAVTNSQITIAMNPEQLQELEEQKKMSVFKDIDDTYIQQYKHIDYRL